MTVFSVMLVFLISIVTLVESENTLIFTQILFRHGARAPSLNITNPSYAEHYFHRGLGELTDRGFENSYKLGKFLKKRYVDSGFLNSNMYPGEMYWRSVNKRRCLSSAATVGASMFEDPVRHLQVAVLSDEDGENLLSYDQAKCPKEEELVKRTCKNFKGIYSPWPHYEEFIANCLNYTNPVFNQYPFHTVEAHLNEYKNGIPLPPALANNIDTIMKMYTNVTQFITGTGHFHDKEVMRMKFGVLVDTLLKNIENKIVNKKENKSPLRYKNKFIVYSTQDWVLMGVLDAFGVLEKSVGLDKYPEYNSMIIMEVWKTDKNERVVKMYYKAEEVTEVDHKLIDLTAHVRNCTGMTDGCPLQNFYNGSEEYAFENRPFLCNSNGIDPSRSAPTVLSNPLFERLENIKKRKKRFAGPE